MALIRVNSTDTWKCGAHVFDTVLGDAHKWLASSNDALAKSVHSVVESNLHWWSMVELAADDFRSFVAAVKEVEQKWAGEGPKSPADLDRYCGLMDRLKELLTLLSADARAAGVNSPLSQTSERAPTPSPGDQAR